jgi:ribosome-binding factor A
MRANKMEKFKRVERVNSLVAGEVSRLLEREIDLRKVVLVTITRVETSANLIQAKVFVSVLPENKEKEALENLNRRIYDIQQKFNQRVNMRPVPRLIFILDKKTGEAARVEELLEQIKKTANLAPMSALNKRRKKIFPKI